MLFRSGALGACALTFALGRNGTVALVLAGAAVSSLTAAGIALALNFAPNPYAAYEIMTWIMGSLADKSWTQVWLVLPFAVLGCALLALRVNLLKREILLLLNDTDDRPVCPLSGHWNCQSDKFRWVALRIIMTANEVFAHASENEHAQTGRSRKMRNAGRLTHSFYCAVDKVGNN